MRITKYEHACVVLEEQGKRLIIDPGKFTEKLADYSNVCAVVVTHVHSDHFDIENLRAIKTTSPRAMFFGPEQVAAEAKEVNMQSEHAGSGITVENFSLAFYGGKHELYEGFENLAVLVNDVFLHPGDSYTTIDKPVKVLGLPASAPWLRVPDTVSYLSKVKPEIAFPIHDSVLSEAGKEIHYRIIGEGAKDVNADWRIIGTGEGIEL